MGRHPSPTVETSSDPRFRLSVRAILEGLLPAWVAPVESDRAHVDSALAPATARLEVARKRRLVGSTIDGRPGVAAELWVIVFLRSCCWLIFGARSEISIR